MDLTTVTLGKVLPYIGSGFGVVTLMLGIMYRDGIVEFLKGFSANRTEERRQILNDVAALKEQLATHTENEEGYWDENNKRLTTLESNYSVIKASTDAQHRETLTALTVQSERIGDLADSVKMLTQILLQERK